MVSHLCNGVGITRALCRESLGAQAEYKIELKVKLLDCETSNCSMYVEQDDTQSIQIILLIQF